MKILTNLLSSLIEIINGYITLILAIGAVVIIALIVFNIVRFISLRQMRQLLYYDDLTGVKKSAYLEKKFNDILVELDRDATLFYINIDNFKNYNDLFGYQTANRILAEFGKRLLELSQPYHHVFRVHSDRFIMIYPEKNDQFGHQILKRLKEPYDVEEQSFSLTVSMGSYKISETNPRFYEILLRGELALERAKSVGKDQWIAYSEGMKEKHHNAFDMYTFIKDALKNEQFFLEFQPIVSSKTKQMVGLESLIRFEDKRRLIFPSELISYAEKFNLIEEIDRYVVEKSFEAYQIFKQKGLKFSFLAVNVSSSEINDDTFVEYLATTAKYYDVDPKSIVIEFTETADPNKLENESRFIEQVRSLGFKVAIDDFGSGYSSMLRLSKNTLDRIKIDKSFVNDIMQSSSNQNLVEAMVGLARAFNLEVIVEGVETEEDYLFMKSLNIEYVQGYYFYKPHPLNEIIDMFTNKNN